MVLSSRLELSYTQVCLNLKKQSLLHFNELVIGLSSKSDWHVAPTSNWHGQGVGASSFQRQEYWRSTKGHYREVVPPVVPKYGYYVLKRRANMDATENKIESNYTATSKTMTLTPNINPD
ncbi:hypothetical protein JHK87_011919 [Glycine soja]|nr:hypothetical protein JHK87_011919 [Glycine soja]